MATFNMRNMKTSNMILNICAFWSVRRIKRNKKSSACLVGTAIAAAGSYGTGQVRVAF